MTTAQNWFERGGADYARYRPEYPSAVASVLAAAAPRCDTAVDVGCGTGQLTVQLARHFRAVIGLDPSRDQLAHARGHHRVRYQAASAEHLPVPDGSVDLVTAAQAAHWFDLSAFYAEARRIAAPGAGLALVSYGVLSLDGDLDDRFRRFYGEELGSFWPPERRLVDEGYRTIEFPFREVDATAPPIEQQLTLAGFLGYVSTWSAVQAARDQGREDLLRTFAADLAALWGDPAAVRLVTWPINLRLGILRP